MTIYKAPFEVDIPDVDLLSFIFESEDSAARDDIPLHAAASSPDQVLTSHQILRYSKRIGHFLRTQYDIGADGPGRDVIFTVSTGQPAMTCVFYGSVIAEGVYTGGSYACVPSEVAWQFRDGPGKIMVVSRDCEELAVAAAEVIGLSLRNVLVLESLPTIRLRSVDGSTECDFENEPEMDWRRITDRHELENSKIAIVYSSGTTSLPKGVQFSHRNFIAQTLIYHETSRPDYDARTIMGEDTSRRILGYMSSAHIGGIQSYFVMSPYLGGMVYWVPKFEYDAFMRYMGDLRITLLLGMPALILAIAKDPNAASQLRWLREANVGAAPLSKDLQVLASEKMENCHLNQVWGLTESTGAATYAPPHRSDTMGTLSCLLPNVEMRIVDENGEDVEPGQPGEALLRGPSITKGYHRCPKETRNAFIDDGWFKTGDILRMDGDLVYLVDRKKDIIKYYGLQVPPAELEGILESHPLIADAGVVGVPLDHAEVPRAFVSLIPSAKDTITEAEFIKELQEYVENKVSDHKKLRGGLRIVNCVPRSATGKILRRQLREMDQMDQARL